MSGTDKSREYCLEMICADFLAGANLDNGNPDVLLHSMQPVRRLANGVGQVAQEGSCSRAIHDAVVARQRQGHHGPDCGLAIDRHDAIGNAPHREYRGLRRADDGAERVDAVHAEVADGEGGAGDIGLT